MAILSKRKATKSLPGARDFADRSGRVGLTSVSRPAGSNLGTVDNPKVALGASPASSLVGTSSITNVGSGSSPVSTTKTPTTSTAVPTLGTKTTPASLTTKTTAKPSSVMAGKTTAGTSTSKPLTSVTKPTTTKTTSTKPTVSTPATKPTSVTTKGTGTTKMPTITTKPSSGGSTLSKTLTGAATGAVLGAGTKAIIDKLTGGSKTSNPTSVVKPAGGTTTKPVTGGTTTKPAGIPVTPKGGTTTKPTGGTTTKPATGGTAGTVTPGGNYQYPSNPSGGTPYDDDGNLMPGWQLDENNDPVWVGLGDDTTTTDGTTTADSNTYVDEETGDVYKMAEDGTWSLQDGDTTVASDGTNTDTTVATNDGNTDLGDGYYQDATGNIYNSDGSLFASIGEDGNYSLYEGDTTTDTTFADNTWTDPDSGEVWNMADDGTWSMEGGEDTYVADNTWTDPDSGAVWTMADNGEWSTDYTDDTDYTDYTVADNTNYDDLPPDEAKSGGLITMMKNGGIPKFADGDVVYSDTEEEVQPWQNVAYNYGEFDDPTMTGDMSLYTNSPAIRNTYTTADSEDTSGTDFTATPGVQYFDDGSYIQTFDDGSTMTVDSEGNVVDSSIGYQTSVDDYGNTTVTDGYGNIVSVYDPEGNVIPLGGGRVNQKPITNVGGSGGVRMTPVNKPQTPKEMIAEQKRAAEEKSTWQSIQDMIGGSGYLGAGAAGAILGSLLGNSDILGGGSSGQNQQALDMSKVGVLDPRTTDFGIGPANYVTYDQYGTPEEMPDLYGTELGKNLNAPGFNPVNEGDYGFDITEEAPAEEVTEEVEGMASGGQPQGGLTNSSSTYFTYGKPVDPMQNLYNPQPMQQPQQPTMGGLAAPGMAPQGMPPQGMSPQGMSPQGMPNQGMPPQGMNQQGMAPQGMAPTGMQPQGMRSGGLPAWSNVPVTNGRLNFRNGAPVHGPGDGQSDDIPAMLADGEYVIDAETVAQIGNGSTKAGAQALDKFRESIRAHKRSAPINKIPPKTKALTSYLKGAK